MNAHDFIVLCENLKGKLIAWVDHYEKGSWIHEVEILMADNTTLVIIDDNDWVTVKSDNSQFDPVEASRIWRYYNMGTSIFGLDLDKKLKAPNKEGIRYQDIMNPPIWPSENRRLNVIWDGDGVTFSWLDDPDNPDNPKNA